MDASYQVWSKSFHTFVRRNRIQIVISGQWADDTERLCAMEPRLRLRRFRLERSSNSGSLDQKTSAKPTELTTGDS